MRNFHEGCNFITTHHQRLRVLHNRSKSNVLKVKSHKDEEGAENIYIFHDDEGRAMGGGGIVCRNLVVVVVNLGRN